jgi:large subunit ribosomal protein L29
MPLPKYQDIQDLSDDAIAEEILANKRKLFELRLQQATRRLDKPHEFRHLRRRIAQLLTLERQRELQVQAAVPSSTEE